MIYNRVGSCFIRRQTNNVAHLLVKASLSYTSLHYHDYMSSYIELDIINDMS